jgi:hypothetical protein
MTTLLDVRNSLFGFQTERGLAQAFDNVSSLTRGTNTGQRGGVRFRQVGSLPLRH